MQYNLLNNIIKSKRPVYIISPHFDDAALSCGELMTQLAGKTSVTIINVFTKAHNKKITLSAKQALKYADFKDAQSLYIARKNEDAKALFGLGKIINLDIEEALFRSKKNKSILSTLLPEFAHVYPTYRWHVTGKIAKNDHAIKELEKLLKKLLPKNAVVFAPYGIGNHVDHQIVRRVCEQLYPDCVIYSDFPYNIRLNTYGQPKKEEYMAEVYPDLQKKSKMLQLYKTQFWGLFPEGKMPDHKEVYFLKK